LTPSAGPPRRSESLRGRALIQMEQLGDDGREADGDCLQAPRRVGMSRFA
jgi:hypothetical protein